jgi:hypothetical protein
MGSARATIRTYRFGLSMLIALTAAAASAEVTTERGSSILVFPKVMYDSQGLLTGEPIDTVIQITNTSNSLVYAHCYYMNAAPVNPSRPVSDANPPRWQEINFDILLTKQQPTHWVVGRGRPQNPSDPICSGDALNNTVTNRDCVNAGFDPGRVPLTPDPFIGELRCVEVDSSGAPINGNHLKGVATLVTPGDEAEMIAADASKYNAIGLLGLNSDLNSNNSDLTLCIGGNVSEECPGGAEYSACPDTVILNHFAEGASNPVVESHGNGPSLVSTELTIVPCTQDLERLERPRVTVQFLLTNEFEELFSASTTVDCWGNYRLSDIAFNIFNEAVIGTRFVQTRMRTAPDQSGFLALAEEFHSQPEAPASSTMIVRRAALNLHGDGERVKADVIRVPEGR